MFSSKSNIGIFHYKSAIYNMKLQQQSQVINFFLNKQFDFVMHFKEHKPTRVEIILYIAILDTI